MLRFLDCEKIKLQPPLKGRISRRDSPAGQTRNKKNPMRRKFIGKVFNPMDNLFGRKIQGFSSFAKTYIATCFFFFSRRRKTSGILNIDFELRLLKIV